MLIKLLLHLVGCLYYTSLSLLSVFRASFTSHCISCIIHFSVHFVHHSLLSAFRASFGQIESGAELAVYITLVFHFSVHFVHHSLLSAFRASLTSQCISCIIHFSVHFVHHLVTLRVVLIWLFILH